LRKNVPRPEPEKRDHLGRFFITNLPGPEIEPMLEPAPAVLTTKDIAVCDGAEAPDNSIVNVHYVQLLKHAAKFRTFWVTKTYVF